MRVEQAVEYALSHVLPDMQREAVAKLDAIFNAG